MAHLAFLFCCFVWGTSFILLERVTHVMGPVEIGLWRLFSGAAVVGVFWWRGRDAYRLSRRDLAYMVFSALLFTAPAQIVQAYVLEQGFGHSFFGAMVAAVPLMTILVSVPLLGTAPSGRELCGVFGGLLCIFLLVEEGMERGMSAGLLALTMVIPLSSALNNTFIKWRLAHVPAAPLTAVLLIVAGVALAPLQFAPATLSTWHIGAPASAVVTPSSVLFLVLLGVVGSGLSTMVFIWMVLEKGPLFAGMTTYVVPVLALVWGTFDGETISPMQAVAIAGVLSMVALVQMGAQPEDAVEGELLPIPADLELAASQPESRVA